MIEVADVFRRFADRYLAAHGAAMLPSHRRAIADILACRTEALGGHLWQCNNCPHEVFSYHSCVMGKFGNGESAWPSGPFAEGLGPSCSALAIASEHGHQLIRWAKRSFAQVWWYDGLNGLKLLARITASVNFGGGQLAVTEPK